MTVKRIVSSVVYVVVFLALVVLKWLVPVYGALGFDVLFLAVSIIGCIEYFNAEKSVPLAQRTVSVAFCAMSIPMFVLLSYLDLNGFIGVAMLLLIYLLVIVVFALAKFDSSTWKTTSKSLFAIAYCGILSCILVAVNHHANNSTVAVMLLFFIVMMTDSFAYVVGLVFRRWVPYKLAPKVSPNKTLIGGVGGVIGGMFGAEVAYWLYYAMCLYKGDVVYDGNVPLWAVFLIIGFALSFVAQAGDLFESYIKRRCGVKDMGKLIPGHGGVLDRFDSMLFVGVPLLISFLLMAL